MNIYYNSVGANATFLLNIPPTNEGLFHENDVKRLGEIGSCINRNFGNSLTSDAAVTYNGSDIKALIRSDDYDTYFIAEENTAVITASWDRPVIIGHIVLKENILKSQRVERFDIEAKINGGFERVYENTVIGYKRIVRLDNIDTDCIRVRITDSRTEPTLAFIGIYEGSRS